MTTQSITDIDQRIADLERQIQEVTSIDSLFTRLGVTRNEVEAARGPTTTILRGSPSTPTDEQLARIVANAKRLGWNPNTPFGPWWDTNKARFDTDAKREQLGLITSGQQSQIQRQLGEQGTALSRQITELKNQQQDIREREAGLPLSRTTVNDAGLAAAGLSRADSPAGRALDRNLSGPASQAAPFGDIAQSPGGSEFIGGDDPSPGDAQQVPGPQSTGGQLSYDVANRQWVRDGQPVSPQEQAILDDNIFVSVNADGSLRFINTRASSNPVIPEAQLQSFAQGILGAQGSGAPNTPNSDSRYPWWDTATFGPLPGGVQFVPDPSQPSGFRTEFVVDALEAGRVFEQALSGQLGPEVQQRVRQFATPEQLQDAGLGAGGAPQQGRVETIDGREFIVQPNGTLQLLPPEQAAQVPTLEQQIDQLILDRNFTEALQIQDFINRASPQERLEGALAFARSPADFFTLSNAQAGTLPLPQSQPGLTQDIPVPGTGADPMRALETLMREQGFTPEQIAIAQGQMRAAIDQGLRPEDAFTAVLGNQVDPGLRAQFQQMITPSIQTTSQVQRIGPQPNFLGQAFDQFFNPQFPTGGQDPFGARPIDPGSTPGGEPFTGGGPARPGGGPGVGPGGVPFAPTAGGPAGQTGQDVLVDGQLFRNVTPQQQDFLRANGRRVEPFTGESATGDPFVQPASFTSGTIGPSGLLTTPRIENLIQGGPQAPAASVFPLAGLRTLSAQQLRNSSPEELEIFGEIGRLAGIPQGTFERELRAGITTGGSPGRITTSGRRRRRPFVQ